MIGGAGAVGGATGAASMPPASRADATTASPAAPAQSGANDTAGRPAPVNGGRGRDAASAKDADAGASTQAEDFASLLANAGDPATGSAIAESAVAETTPAEQSGTVALPEQVLALLDGAWAAVPTAAPEAATTPAMTGAVASEPGTRANAAAIMATSALPAPAQAWPGTIPGPSTSAPASGVGAELPRESALNVEGASTANSAPAFAGLASDDTTASASASAILHPGASAPVLPPSVARAIPGTPLALPADPQTGFDDGLGARIAWMAEQRVGHAEIRLNPEHVGPIEVRVQVDGTRVSAEFHSAHAEVRQAIESSVARLREMLGQQGLQLGHAGVGHRHNGSGESPRGGANEAPATGPTATTAQGSARGLRSRGLVDEYA